MKHPVRDRSEERRMRYQAFGLVLRESGARLAREGRGVWFLELVSSGPTSLAFRQVLWALLRHHPDLQTSTRVALELSLCKVVSLLELRFYCE